MPAATVSFSIGKNTWDRLPLAARQLMWDRLDVYAEYQLKDMIFRNFAESIAESHAQGLAFHEWDEPTRRVLVNQLDEVLKAAPQKAPASLDGEKFVQQAVDTSDRWEKIITAELKFEDATTWEGLDSWFAKNDLDVDSLIDRIVAESIAPYRPES